MTVMHKFKRDMNHELWCSNTLTRLSMSEKLAGILALAGPVSGGLPVGNGLASLETRKTAPRTPPNRAAPEIAKKLLHLRKTYRLGPMRIVWLVRYHASPYRMLKPSRPRAT
ncbi:MAG: hypothetical protein ABIO35_04415 [Nitrobacter sp.]